MKRKWTYSLSLSALAIVTSGCSDSVDHDGVEAPHSAQVAQQPATWPSAGNGISNSRSQPSETKLNAESVRRLGVLWTFETRGDFAATPAVDEARVYVPDSGGGLHALDRATGKPVWTHRVSDYTGITNDWSKVTPAVTEDALYLGNQAGRNNDVGATVFAVDKRTGAKKWATKVDDHPAAIITAAPVVYGDRVYVGVSSWEEFRAPGPYVCCSFRGSVVALDRNTGRVVWKFYTTPGTEAPGYTGVAVWGSTPVVDPKRHSLYVATGNNYKVPNDVLDCQALPTQDQIATCVTETKGFEHNYFNSVLALDLDTGKVKWAHRASVFDAFTGACLFPGSPECTNPRGKDFDFGQGPILYDAVVNGKPRQLLGAGQKSGYYWSLNPDDGSVVWHTQVGPGGIFGGLEWGSASDGARVYTAVANSESQPWTFPSGEVARSGLWAALDAVSGKVLWQTRGTPAVQSTARGSVSTANGVVYGGSFDVAGTMYAFDAKTGETLWSYPGGAAVATAPAIVDGVLYWGAGAGGTVAGTRVNKLYAFAPKAGATTPTTTPSGTGPGVAPANTWRGIYDRYLGAGTVGHCLNCHGEMNTAASAYAFLRASGQIDGARSTLVGTGSKLTWFGGTMPPGGPAGFPEAVRDMRAWATAGAKND